MSKKVRSANALNTEGPALKDQITASARPALAAFSAATVALLLVACASVANLLLSRGTSRRRELAVRSVLGASRGRIARQLLLESLILSALGGVVGVLTASALVRLFLSLAPPSFPRVPEVAIDAPVAGFALLLSLATGLVAGVMPALRATRRNLAPSLRDPEWTATGSGGWVRSMLLVAESAFCVVLLVGGVLLVRSFVRLVSVDGGYDRQNVVLAELILPRGDSQANRRKIVTADLLGRIRSTPGVAAAGVGSQAPFVWRDAMAAATLPWTGPDGRPVEAQVRIVRASAGYAEALGLRLRAGRFPTDADALANPRPILVSDAFVRRYVHDGRAVVGRQLEGTFAADEKQVSEIVGIVGEVLHRGLDTAPVPTVYKPMSSAHEWVTLVARSVGPTAPLVAAVRRIAATIFVVFSTVAALLAGAGLYSVLALLVSQRRRELGVRSALGATRGDLVRLVVRHGLRTTIAGVVIGIIVSLATSRLLRSLLFGVSPTDTVAYATAGLLLIGVAIAASMIPASRAARTNPLEVLRSE